MTLPNLITLFRLLLVPLTIWLILAGAFGAAFVVFCIAGLSDAIDGYIARRFDLQSRLGAVLDPLADKVLLMSVYVTLGIIAVLPAWLVILVVARDVMIVGGFVLIGLIGPAPEVRPIGISKLNTMLQILFAAAVLVDLAWGLPSWSAARAWLRLAVAATTVASGTAYLVQWSRSTADGGPGT